MSAGNVESVRAAFAAYNRRDIDGILAIWRPDAVLDWSRSYGPEVGVYRGHDEIRKVWGRFLDAWDEARIVIEDPIEVEDDLLIVENVAYLRGRGGIETRAHAVFLIAMQDGKTS